MRVPALRVGAPQSAVTPNARLGCGDRAGRPIGIWQERTQEWQERTRDWQERTRALGPSRLPRLSHRVTRDLTLYVSAQERRPPSFREQRRDDGVALVV